MKNYERYPVGWCLLSYISHLNESQVATGRNRLMPVVGSWNTKKQFYQAWRPAAKGAYHELQCACEKRIQRSLPYRAF